MKNRTFARLLAALTITAGALHATSALAQMGTSFTYQGSLSVSGAAFTGNADFRFRLYDAPTGGNQVGVEVPVSAVQVSGGLLTTEVDFGAVFSNQTVYLEIDAKPSAADSFTTLTPRQKITPSPVSTFSNGPWAQSGSSLSYSGLVNVTSDSQRPNGEAITIKNGLHDYKQLLMGVNDDFSSAWIGSIWQGYNWTPLTLQPGGGRVGIGLNNWQPAGMLGVLGAAPGLPGAGESGLPGISAGTDSDPSAAYNSYGWTQTPCFEARAGQLDPPPAIIFHHLYNSTIGLVVQDAAGSPHALHVTGAANEPPSGLIVDGNVGVGETNPLASLDLRGGDDTTVSHGVYDMAFGYRTGGYRHWIRTIHDGSPTANSMDFFVNSSSTPDGSSAPGTGNTLVMRLTGGGNVGIGTASPGASFKLDVAGSIRCVAMTQTSSREFKQDIAPLTGALDSVMKLHGVSYRWNDKAPCDVQGKRDIGFIADEMNDVLPDIVAKDEGGKPVGIDYGKVAAVEVEAIKQLKAENDRVKADNADLKARLEKIEAILAAQARAGAK